MGIAGRAIAAHPTPETNRLNSDAGKQPHEHGESHEQHFRFPRGHLKAGTDQPANKKPHHNPDESEVGFGRQELALTARSVHRMRKSVAMPFLMRTNFDRRRARR